MYRSDNNQLLYFRLLSICLAVLDMQDIKHTKHGTDSETMKIVEEIKSAETQYDNAIALAKTNAQRIVLQGKENALAEKVRAEEEALKIKNDIITRGKSDTDQIVEKSLEKAKADAAKLSKKSLNEADVIKLTVDFLKVELE